MTTTATRACDLCGAPVERKTGAKRAFPYRRGLDLPVPDDFAMPTCTACGETYLSDEDLARLEEVLHPAFVAWQTEHLGRVVEHIRAAHPNVRLRDLERACGVTGTYLSHVLRGTKDASQMLVNLLEAFSLNPAELQRRLEGTSWEEAVTRREAARLRAMQITIDWEPAFAPVAAHGGAVASVTTGTATRKKGSNVIAFPVRAGPKGQYAQVASGSLSVRDVGIGV